MIDIVRGEKSIWHPGLKMEADLTLLLRWRAKDIERRIGIPILRRVVSSFGLCPSNHSNHSEREVIEGVRKWNFDWKNSS